MSEEEARTMLFKGLHIGPSTITFDGQTCRDVKFDSEPVQMNKYLMERYQVGPQELGLENGTMKVFTTNCSLPGFQEYMRLPDSRLVVSIMDVVFIFSPKVNY